MPTSTTRVTRHILAPRSEVYRALLDPRAVAKWMVPDGMTSQVHAFDARENGAFRISLTYDEPSGTGKTAAHTDTYHGHFVRLAPDAQVVQTMEFETADAAMSGEMTVTFTLTDADEGTDVLAVHERVPPGVAPADNETGWRMSLDKLAALLERGQAQAGRQAGSRRRRLLPHPAPTTRPGIRVVDEDPRKVVAALKADPGRDVQLLMVPGYTGSGPGHWQSLWEQADPSIRRVEQDNWNHPEPAAWSQAIEAAVRGARRPAVLVAHSCGAIAVAYWAARFQTPIAGAFLVAPPDSARDDLDAPIRDFGMPELRPLPFPALVVASDDDPYCDAHRAAECAAGWMAGLVRAGAVGHLNTASGHGPWPEGRQWLDAFLARVVGEAGGLRAGQSV